MRVVEYTEFGSPDVLKIVDDLDKPSVVDGKVLVEVYASSINPWDDKMRSGFYREMIPPTFPIIPGGDFSGVVSDVHEGSGFSKGDRVYGQIGGMGALAEYINVDFNRIAKKPKNLDFVESASIALVGCSALQALEDHIHLKAGQRILIHGGSGGIGSIAIQLAKHLGAYVITTASPSGLELVKSLGVDEAIDYKSQDFEEIVKSVDAVFDTVAGDTLEKSVDVLKSGGILVSMLGEPKKERVDITTIYQQTQVRTPILNRLTEYIEEGVIKPQVDRVFSLDQIVEAYIYFEKGHPKGKVAIRIRG